MDAQHQAEAAGVSYDILTEADLTNVAKLSQYSALIFPDFQNVQSGQVSAIANALHQVVYDYHVPIITAGNFMTNDQTGAPLPGNSYANMQDLLNLTLNQSGTATYSVTPDAAALANNPILAGYTSGQLIGGASGEFAGDNGGPLHQYGLPHLQASRRVGHHARRYQRSGRGTTPTLSRASCRRPRAARTPTLRRLDCSATATCCSR